MDLETENRIASLLMEDARRMRSQAEKEGVQVYLQKPNTRGRPNSRFLTATVLGVQQANRAVEVNEMWRAREKEIELDSELKKRARDRKKWKDQNARDDLLRSRHEQASGTSTSSPTKRSREDSYSSDDYGLKDYEVEEFLHSRAKRGRGSIGSRMDEPGPYMPHTSSDHNEQLVVSPDRRVREEWEHRIFGPEKPSFMKSQEPMGNSGDSDSESSRKHRSKERSSKRKNSHKTKKKGKCSKHHRHKSRGDM